jgi:hypothetical protein
MSFQAKYAGYCHIGEHRIHEGDQVQYDEDGKVIHVDCADQPPVDHDAPGRNERNCPECFTIHAGECF